jgi:hypothetical protein
MVDKVYEDSMRRYTHARMLVEDLIHGSLDSIVGRVDTSGKGVPIMVFNTVGWPRTDAAEADVPFSDPGVQQIALFDAEGNGVPVQFLNVLRNEDGGIRQARIAFVARNIPAMGYAIYHAAPAVRRH